MSTAIAEPAPRYLTEPEAAKLARTPRQTLRKWALAGHPIGRVRIGTRRVVYDREVLERYLSGGATPTGGADVRPSAK